MRVPNIEKPCEECNKISKHHSSWAKVYGHLLCGVCKRRKSYPVIFGKNNMPTNFAIKVRSSPTSILSDEARLIYSKHIKTSGNESEAKDAVHSARFWTKISHVRNREYKSNFKKEFENMVEVKNAST